MRYWKVNCMEDDYPGLWQTWFLQQTVAIGWPTPHFSFEGPTPDRSWAAARAAAPGRVGDRIVVQLSNSRVGRIGTVTQAKIKDTHWNPTVPVDKKNPEGEMGRRISRFAGTCMWAPYPHRPSRGFPLRRGSRGVH